MKKLQPLLFVILLLTFSISGAYAADTKLGYVDLARLFDEYHKTKSYDEVLAQKSEEYEAEKNKRIEKIREEQGKLSLLAEDKKAAKEAEIETLKADLLEWDRQQKQDITKDRNEKVREILLEIEKVISDYAEKKKYAMILMNRVLIYGNEGYNLTEDILKELNAAK